MGTTTLGDKLRKNGKRPSCEPCRVRKQSCDHEQPCQRCQRHNRACFYAAAPMTKPKTNAAATLPSPSPDGIPTPSSVFSVPALPAAHSPKPPIQKKIIKRHNPLTLRTGGNLGFHRGANAWYGHIGRTSFNAILEEAEEVPCSLWESSSTMSDEQAADGWDDRGFEFCKEIMAWLPKRERFASGHSESTARTLCGPSHSCGIKSGTAFLRLLEHY